MGGRTARDPQLMGLTARDPQLMGRTARDPQLMGRTARDPQFMGRMARDPQLMHSIANKRILSATLLTSEWMENEVPFTGSSTDPPSALLSMEIMEEDRHLPRKTRRNLPSTEIMGNKINSRVKVIKGT